MSFVAQPGSYRVRGTSIEVTVPGPDSTSRTIEGKLGPDGTLAFPKGEGWIFTDDPDDCSA